MGKGLYGAQGEVTAAGELGGRGHPRLGRGGLGSACTWLSCAAYRASRRERTTGPVRAFTSVRVVSRLGPTRPLCRGRAHACVRVTCSQGGCRGPDPAPPTKPASEARTPRFCASGGSRSRPPAAVREPRARGFLGTDAARSSAGRRGGGGGDGSFLGLRPRRVDGHLPCDLRGRPSAYVCTPISSSYKDTAHWSRGHPDALI